MEKTKVIKKEELKFDLTKIRGVGKIDVFEDRVEIIFILED